jgi:hypothetical protein
LHYGDRHYGAGHYGDRIRNPQFRNLFVALRSLWRSRQRERDAASNSFDISNAYAFVFLKNRIHAILPKSIPPPGPPPMAKSHKKSRAAKPQPARERAPRIEARRATAERKQRILERLTTGASVMNVARVEKITVRRVRQIVAEMLAKREADPAAGFVQLQIARLGDAMVVAHTMMMEGDLQAMDRLIKLTAELDRYHGFGRTLIAAEPEAPAPQIAAQPRELLLPKPAAEDSEREIFRPASR